MNKGDWKNIRQAYEAGNRKIFESKPGREWATRNRGQGWRAEFDGSGVRLTADSGETRLGLKLDGYGFSGNTTTVGPKSRRVTTADNRVEYVWDERLTEWFVNDEKGLEQGWTLASAPSGATTARLEIDVTGGLKAASVDSGAVALTGVNGATAMTYGGLKAWDATGRTLPAQLEAVSGNRIRVTVETADAVYPVTIDPTVQQAYLKASNTDVADFFGNSVAVSGDTVVIGAFGEDGNATGVNGNQADNSAADSGAVYVFVRNGGTWSQQAYLKASNTNTIDLFGVSVAVSGDTIVVGASGEASNATGVNGNQADNSMAGAGAAYVFVRNGMTWNQQAYLKASNTGSGDRFGTSINISGDTVVVGALQEDSNATGVNGDEANGSSVDAGAAYVFVRNGIAWSQQAYLKASNTGADDRFGVSAAVSGDTVVVGAFTEDSNATGVDGDGVNNSATNAGAAYVFVRNGTTWSQQAYLKASNTDGGDQFGFSVAVSGNTVVVSANNEDSNATGVNGNQANNSAFESGAVYVFVRVGTVWSQQAYLKSSNTGLSDQFGRAVAISGEMMVVGANQESSNATGVNGDQANDSASLAGAAYLFVRNGSIWSQQSYLKASNTGAFDEFGRTVALSGDTVVVGATGEDSNATGVNGNQADNSANFAGAAYIFTFPVSCSYSLSANSINFPASGGSGGVTLTTTASCAWNISGIPGWISNVSPANGTGTTAITYSVNPNFSATPRSATLTIGDQSYTVNQDGAVPVNSLLSFSFTSQSVNPPTCSPTYSNDLVLTATVTNTSGQTIYSPSFNVLELREANGTPPANPFRLLTADGATCGSGGLVGAIQSTDGQSTPVTLPTLAPGQSVSVRFVIAMQSLRRIRFVIDANGSLAPPAGSASRPVTGKYNVATTGVNTQVGSFAFLIEPSGKGRECDVVPDGTRHRGLALDRRAGR